MTRNKGLENLAVTDMVEEKRKKEKFIDKLRDGMEVHNNIELLRIT